MGENTPMWVGITYLIYIVTMMAITLGGTGYAVFVLGHSGWWFVLAVFVASCSYRPGRWAEMLTGDTGVFGVDKCECRED